MARLRRLPLIVALVVAIAIAGARTPTATTSASDLPAALTDAEFWNLSQALSEPGGVFNSDNLVSNEVGFQKVLPELTDRHPAGGVYLGVGPEQNFTYIAALQPAMAFIIDIRRGNRDLHLMYKALFDLAADRAEFVSLLFSRGRPDGLTRQSSASEVFAAYARVDPTEAVYRKNLAALTDRLVNAHKLPLTEDEIRGIEYVYGSFFKFGPAIAYSSSHREHVSSAISTVYEGTYASLMQATDVDGDPRGFLSSEERFAAVKALEARNLLVPVVGDFAGPKAVRAVGDWLRARRATVDVFYVSNVEDYLRTVDQSNHFCENVSALPIDERSDFIRRGSPTSLRRVSPETKPPVPVGFSALPGGVIRTVTVKYSDGTSRILSADEAVVELQRLPFSGNHLARMADDISCRR